MERVPKWIALIQWNQNCYVFVENNWYFDVFLTYRKVTLLWWVSDNEFTGRYTFIKGNEIQYIFSFFLFFFATVKGQATCPLSLRKKVSSFRSKAKNLPLGSNMLSFFSATVAILKAYSSSKCAMVYVPMVKLVQYALKNANIHD